MYQHQKKGWVVGRSSNQRGYTGFSEASACFLDDKMTVSFGSEVVEIRVTSGEQVTTAVETPWQAHVKWGAWRSHGVKGHLGCIGGWNPKANHLGMLQTWHVFFDIFSRYSWLPMTFGTWILEKWWLMTVLSCWPETGPRNLNLPGFFCTFETSFVVLSNESV